MNTQNHHTLPEGWVMKRLADITDPKRPVSYGIVQTGEPVESGVKCIRVVDLVDGKINKSQLITTSPEISNQYKRTITKVGDIIFALRGKIGDSALINAELEGINLTRGVALIAPSKGVDSVYLKQQIGSPQMKSVFIQSTGGSALQEIAINVLRKIKIPLPPLAEQNQIAAVLGTWDKSIEQANELLKTLRIRHRGLMHALLTGKKRLPVFSNEWKEVKLGDVFKERSQTGYNNLRLLSITADQGVINRNELIKRDTSNEDKSKYKRICPGDIGYNTMRMWQGRSAVSTL